MVEIRHDVLEPFAFYAHAIFYRDMSVVELDKRSASAGGTAHLYGANSDSRVFGDNDEIESAIWSPNQCEEVVGVQASGNPLFVWFFLALAGLFSVDEFHL